MIIVTWIFAAVAMSLMSGMHLAFVLCIDLATTAEDLFVSVTIA